MHYYQFSIGDYAKDTRHLSWDEDMAYRRLLDAYYAKEEPLPLDLRSVYRLVGAQSDVQREAVAVVLTEFFVETADGWRNKRADAVIAAFHVKSQRASESAKARWEAKAKQPQSQRNANASLDTCERIDTLCEGNAIHKPKTINQKPKNNITSAPDGVAVEVWADFIILRNKLRAPVTNTVLTGIAREAAKAGIQLGDALRICCERGWRGFKAEWLANKTPMQTAHQASTLAAARSIFGDERSLNNERIIDITPRKALT